MKLPVNRYVNPSRDDISAISAILVRSLCIELPFPPDIATYTRHNKIKLKINSKQKTCGPITIIMHALSNFITILVQAKNIKLISENTRGNTKTSIILNLNSIKHFYILSKTHY